MVGGISIFSGRCDDWATKNQGTKRALELRLTNGEKSKDDENDLIIMIMIIIIMNRCRCRLLQLLHVSCNDREKARYEDATTVVGEGMAMGMTMRLRC